MSFKNVNFRDTIRPHGIYLHTNVLCFVFVSIQFTFQRVFIFSLRQGRIVAVVAKWVMNYEYVFSQNADCTNQWETMNLVFNGCRRLPMQVHTANDACQWTPKVLKRGLGVKCSFQDLKMVWFFSLVICCWCFNNRRLWLTWARNVKRPHLKTCTIWGLWILSTTSSWGPKKI